MSWRDGRTRSVCKKIMFTPEEWSEIDELYRKVKPGFGYKSFADFARDLLLRGRVVNVIVACDPRQIRSDIRRIGVNINQVIRLANATKSVSDEKIDELAQHMRQIDQAFQRMTREYNERIADAYEERI